MMRAFLVLVGATLVSSCGTPDGRTTILRPEQGGVPLPESGRVYAYDAAAVAAAHQTHFSLREDLRIVGGAGGWPSFAGGSLPPRIEVGSDGRIYVLDTSDARVLAGHADGTYDRSIGRAGDGPGELRGPTSLAVVGDLLVVLDWEGDRSITVFSADGDFVDRLRLDGFPSRIAAATDHSFLVISRCRAPAAHCVRRVDLDSGRVASVVSIQEPEPARGDLAATVVERFLRGQNAETTEAQTGAFYAMATEGYEVARVDLDGEVEWNLRMDWPARAVPAADREYIARWRDELRPLLSVSASQRLEVPATLDALSMIRVDNDGWVWVFPADGVRRDPEWQEWRPRPVHVFSSDATLVRTGTLEFAPQAWQVARGGEIYGVRLDEETLEWAVTRSRLSVSDR